MLMGSASAVGPLLTTRAIAMSAEAASFLKTL